MKELPEGWASSSVSSLCNTIRGVSFNKDQVSTVPIEHWIPVLRANNLANDRIDLKDLIWVSPAQVSALQKLQINDVIVAMSSGSTKVVGKTAQNVGGFSGSFGALCGVLRPNLAINAKYFGYFFRARKYRNEISALAAGTNINNIKKEHFETIQFPLPPLAEQKRIVAKLDELLPKVEACKERLEKIPTILKRFRQSVLAAAVSGKLTEEWRKDRYACQGFDSDISNTWEVVSLRDVVLSFNYGSSAKSEETGAVPVLRMGNIQNGEIDWKDLVFSNSQNEIEKYNLAPNTVLFNRTNSPELVGKSAIYRGERRALFAGYLIRIITSDRLNPEYLNICLNSPMARLWCREVKSDGVSQSNINAQKLAAFEIPLPPIEEQSEIVSIVKKHLLKLGRITASVTHSLQFSRRITDAVLSQAFSGTLVPQDPNDEPASALLERIKQSTTEATNTSNKRSAMRNSKNKRA